VGQLVLKGSFPISNITIDVVDSNGNVNETAVGNFTVRDSTPLNVTDITPENGSVFDLGQTIEIGANVTDNIAVANVSINITQPDASVVQINLSANAGTEFFNTSFTFPLLNGTYTVLFITNDTSSNINETEITILVGNDSLAPNVSIDQPANDTVFNQSDLVVIIVNATDNIGAEIEFDGTIGIVNFDSLGAGLFQGNFSNTSFIGGYNITIDVIDTNGNFNDTITGNFTVRDSTPLNVTDITPQNGSIFDLGETIEIGANVSDNVAVANVSINITQPDSSVVQINLSANAGTEFFNTTFTFPSLNGTYTVLFITNDTSSNINETEITILVGNDSLAPNVSIEQPANDTAFNQSDVVVIIVNATDNIGVANVTADIIFDSTIAIVNFDNIGGALWEGNFTNTSFVGDYNITLDVTDTNGNVNDTTVSNFSVRSACGDLTSSRTLQNNVSSIGTCFNITADDVVLDCAGFTINYGSGGAARLPGIAAVGKTNITVKHCTVLTPGIVNIGLNFSGVNDSLIEDNTFLISSTSTLITQSTILD